ncbi:MAG: efflux RND transporter periplasmic adaptor subunit [Anaerolineales bacterium]|nr:efflux RND transporter periplasmic adaptor subunit [Anaerolineales bacterium]
MHKNKRFLIPIVLAVLLAIAGGWYLLQALNARANHFIRASGTIEAVEVLVAPEQGGRVVEVMAQKGDLVETGQPLLRLDDELLQSQRQRALTALDAAQANLVTAQTGLDLAQATLKAVETNREATAANTEVELLKAEQALKDLYETHEVTKAQALQAVTVANRAVREAQYRLDNFTVPIDQQDLTAMEGIEMTKARLDQAREAFEPYKYYSSGNQTREDLREALDEAQSDYDSAVRRLEYETALEQAEAQLDRAMQDLEKLQDGPDPDDVAVLEARITAIKVAPRQADAAVEQARVGLSQAQARLEQAHSAVAQAQAELELVEKQLGKLVVYAAASGIVLSRSVEPGEVIQPGAAVMTLGQIDNLTITVYVPEDRYGQIDLSETAQVTVDSFAGETFSAVVVYIADQAEFTPRNVQTAEGRRTTVFAVELLIDSPQGKLKPGMPADVCFGCP